MKKILTFIATTLICIACIGEQIATIVDVAAGSKSTNLWSGATRVYSISMVDSTGTSGTNFSWLIYDSPYSQLKAPGFIVTNGIAWTNTGYATFTQFKSNMNFNVVGANILNSITNYEGVVTTITNSAVLSNYVYTLSNWSSGYTINKLKLAGVTTSNAVTTTFEFADGLWFGKGITITNHPGWSGVAIFTIMHEPSVADPIHP